MPKLHGLLTESTVLRFKQRAKTIDLYNDVPQLKNEIKEKKDPLIRVEYADTLRSRRGRGAGGGASGGAVPSGQIQLSASSFTANAAQGTAIGTLSATGGTGTYTFTLTDSHTNAVQVAGTNGVNLQVGSAASSAGSFNITVNADNGAGSVLNRTFLVTATAPTAPTFVPTFELLGF